MENKLFDIPAIDIDPDMTNITGSITFKGVYKSAYRICQFAFPLLNKLGFGVHFKSGAEMYTPKNIHSSKEWTKIARFYETGKTGMSIWIYDKNQPHIKIQTMCFIRKYDKDLKDYPRIHLPTEQKQLPESVKIQATLQMCEKMKLHFLVILMNQVGRYNAKPALYWFGKYADIPEENWMLSDRFGKGMKDRMSIIQKNMTYSFVQKEQLKEIIIQNL